MRAVILYDNVEYSVENNIKDCMNKLDNEECDAVFAFYDDVRIARLYNRLKYKYTLMDFSDCVPPHGQGIYCILTNGKRDSISSPSRRICLSISMGLTMRRRSSNAPATEYNCT